MYKNMPEWPNADNLKQEYLVYGSFYNIVDTDQSITKCRNVLEIYNRSGSFEDTLLAKPYSYIPNAIFIMMNPGSSKPEESTLELFNYDVGDMNKMAFKNYLVKAKPDITQYQVMRVMKNNDWNHVRVINLSDIREPKSSLFFKKCKEFHHDDFIHSIFSDIRADELMNALNIDSEIPLVLAWGTSNELKELAIICNTQLQNINIKNRKVAVRSDDLPEELCYHASPTLDKQKKFWLEKICRAI
jgi:hypothetical protein